MQPLEFVFDHSKYTRVCKFQSKCDVERTVRVIENSLDEDEMRWFYNHQQFKHIFHMFKHANRKVMGMWMLLLRTVRTLKKKEIWFVVNGVPIRYSMREHALISGLDCSEYPLDYENAGSFELVQRCFGKKNKIDWYEVENKLESMEKCADRLKVAVLYFLCTVINRKTKDERGFIDSFLLKVADNLVFCKKFPWGRFTFLNTITNINLLLSRFNGEVRRTSAFPGFILSLEVLAFECIPDLKKAFREDVEHVHGIDSSCPRMCRQRFKDTGHKGISLEKIYDALGATKEIYSTLEPEANEIRLMRRLTVEVVDDVVDPIPDGWMRRLRSGNHIWWEDLYQRDIESRNFQSKRARALGVEAEVGMEADVDVEEPVAQGREDDKLDALEKKMMEKYKQLEDKLLKDVDAKYKILEQMISELKNRGNIWIMIMMLM